MPAAKRSDKRGRPYEYEREAIEALCDNREKAQLFARVAYAFCKKRLPEGFPGYWQFTESDAKRRAQKQEAKRWEEFKAKHGKRIPSSHQEYYKYVMREFVSKYREKKRPGQKLSRNPEAERAERKARRRFSIDCPEVAVFLESLLPPFKDVPQWIRNGAERFGKRLEPGEMDYLTAMFILFSIPEEKYASNELSARAVAYKLIREKHPRIFSKLPMFEQAQKGINKSFAAMEALKLMAEKYPDKLRRILPDEAAYYDEPIDIELVVRGLSDRSKDQLFRLIGEKYKNEVYKMYKEARELRRALAETDSYLINTYLREIPEARLAREGDRDKENEVFPEAEAARKPLVSFIKKKFKEIKYRNTGNPKPCRIAELLGFHRTIGPRLSREIKRKLRPADRKFLSKVSSSRIKDYWPHALRRLGVTIKKVSSGAKKKQRSEPEPVELDTYDCLHCGKEVPADTLVCPRCGHDNSIDMQFTQVLDARTLRRNKKEDEEDEENMHFGR